ncbi:MAG: ATP-grasp domain-containing protein [Phycisphaerae bacterium]|nr:ATP-grasp domain-containing protein [Phycisphaerae bacterium]
MKIAIVYNRESRNVVNLFGIPNQEKIGQKTITRLTNALKKGGHQVVAFEGDKDLVNRIEEFMPRVVKGERPGMVFNVSYGIQGQARYTHVPSILEMVGIPYVASGPLAHSLALDKVVTKMILQQQGLPTPEFAVLDGPDAPLPDLPFPLIVKPKNEAVSFGLRVVNNEDEMREGVEVIFSRFQQPVLVERYVKGREINVGLIGNNPPEALPPVEIVFGGEGEAIYTWEDKTGQSGRTISHLCPAPIDDELRDRSQDLARKAFTALGCYDCARVDMRLDDAGNLYILEVNSLPSLGEHGSYLVGAHHVGMDFAATVNRLVREASARYFGTPEPPKLDGKSVDPPTHVFAFITQRRDEIENRLKEWTEIISHTGDPIGLQESVRRVDQMLTGLGMRPVPELTDDPAAWTWETAKGLQGGTLLVGHLDRPVHANLPTQMFRREPEWLYGDGIGSSRAPLVSLEYALRALRGQRLLRRLPLGVLYYTDEGRDARYSAQTIRAAMAQAKRVLVLRPGNVGDRIITQRRGQRRYRFTVEGQPLRPGRPSKTPEVLRWVFEKLESFAKLSSRKQRVSVSALDIDTERLPLLLPHRVTTTILMTYPDAKLADAVEEKMRSGLDRRGPRWELKLVSDRPPMRERRLNVQLARAMERLAAEWEIPLTHESSVWPSVAGLVPAKVACVCGVGPVARDLGTPHESVQRISLVQRTLILAQSLLTELGK